MPLTFAVEDCKCSTEHQSQLWEYPPIRITIMKCEHFTEFNSRSDSGSPHLVRVVQITHSTKDTRHQATRRGINPAAAPQCAVRTSFNLHIRMSALKEFSRGRKVGRDAVSFLIPRDGELLSRMRRKSVLYLIRSLPAFGVS
jgi:hypothetical protein